MAVTTQPGRTQCALLMPQIQALYLDVGRFVSPSFDEWLRGFLRQPDAAREVEAWQRIAVALKNFTRGNVFSPRATAKLIGELSALSTGAAASELGMPEREAMRLQRCFEAATAA